MAPTDELPQPVVGVELLYQACVSCDNQLTWLPNLQAGFDSDCCGWAFKASPMRGGPLRFKIRYTEYDETNVIHFPLRRCKP